jgi:hypothetical protein
LFVALLEAGTDGMTPTLARLVEQSGNTVRFSLEPGASFSDGSPLDAHAVVWSWQRALRRTTRAADLSPFSVFQNGRELIEGRLLRVAQSQATSGPPFSVFGQDADVSRANGASLAAGADVRVLDSNVRRVCCGRAVPLFASPDATDAAPAVLAADDVGVILAQREVGGVVWLRLRGSDGLAGWTSVDTVTLMVPPVSLRKLVQQGDASLVLRAGPDPAAPVRDELRDDDEVELLEPGPAFSLVLSAASGLSGYVESSALTDALGTRTWVLVQSLTESDAVGWLPSEALLFDPGALPARAVSALELEVDLVGSGGDLTSALRAFSAPALRPVPQLPVQAHGFSWAEPARIVTSGPFSVEAGELGILVLHRRRPVPSRAPATIRLWPLPDGGAALHLLRAGAIDGLFDGMLPVDLRRNLERFSDYRAGPAGGSFIAPEIASFDIAMPDLAALRVGSAS